MVICLERGAVLHMAQLMPLSLTVSCFSKIQIGFTFLVPAYPGSPGKRAVKCVCVCGLVEFDIIGLTEIVIKETEAEHVHAGLLLATGQARLNSQLVTFT